MSSRYITTRPVSAAVASEMDGMLPTWARSIVGLPVGDTDDSPVCFRAHESEIHHVRKAIREATARIGLRALEQAARRA